MPWYPSELQEKVGTRLGRWFSSQKGTSGLEPKPDTYYSASTPLAPRVAAHVAGSFGAATSGPRRAAGKADRSGEVGSWRKPGPVHLLKKNDVFLVGFCLVFGVFWCFLLTLKTLF